MYVPLGVAVSSIILGVSHGNLAKSEVLDNADNADNAKTDTKTRKD